MKHFNYYNAKFSCLTLGNSQEVSGKDASAVLGANATLKWNLTKSNGFDRVAEIEVFRGKRRHKSSLLLEYTLVKSYAKKIFNSRLSGLPIGEKDGYVMTITDVRYNDSGFFYFAAGFTNSVLLKQVNATIKLSVNGKPGVFVIFGITYSKIFSKLPKQCKLLSIFFFFFNSQK